jgi:hypothetical protein
MRKIKITEELRDMIFELKSSTKLASLLGDSNRFQNFIKKRTPIHLDELIEIRENIEIDIEKKIKVKTKINDLLNANEQNNQLQRSSGIKRR